MSHNGITRFLPRAEFHRLIEALVADGRTVIGPTVETEAIVYGEIKAASDLPEGWSDEQAPGQYQLVPRDDGRLFAYSVGPTAWKRFTFPPETQLIEADRAGSELTFSAAVDEARPSAFIGVRACDLAALGVTDRVFADGKYTDPHYRARRLAAFIVAVQCTHPAQTCFCSTMGTGPEVEAGADIVLTELDDGFVATASSEEGASFLAGLDLQEASTDQGDAATSAVARARELLGEALPFAGLADRIGDHPDHPRWDNVATRCLACTNCTLTCPTCFCNGHVPTSDLSGEHTGVDRHWNSCFMLGFAEVAGGNFRSRVRDRYRQWLTHKFSTWFDQFGTTGCVGCGRCITWCPVGIDVREEVAAILELPAPAAPSENVRATDAGGRSLAQPVSTDGSRDVLPPMPTRVLGRLEETADTVTLTLDATVFEQRPQAGQFLMVSVPGVGSPPISISRIGADTVDITVRGVGEATRALCAMEPGTQVGVSPPLGRGWPLDAAQGKDVLVVAGGIGLAPVRPIVDAVLADRGRFGMVHLYIGARTPRDLVFAAEMAALAQREDIVCGRAVDRADAIWNEPVGVVTSLFDRASWLGPGTVVYMCGPEVMMTATLHVLAAADVRSDQIFLTMERRMDCGVGLCGHCQIGPYFVCRDGPVFSAAELTGVLGVEGL